jgi:rubrerythrin
MSVIPETSREARREPSPETLSGKPPLRCTECGYEIRSYRAQPPCPMCREVSWEHAPWRPFTRSRAD